MVTPHLVHMLSQSSGTVEMRWCGHWYARNIFYREMARKKQFQPNVTLYVRRGSPRPLGLVFLFAHVGACRRLLLEYVDVRSHANKVGS
jgi:hypothetical protein